MSIKKKYLFQNLIGMLGSSCFVYIFYIYCAVSKPYRYARKSEVHVLLLDESRVSKPYRYARKEKVIKLMKEEIIVSKPYRYARKDTVSVS